MSDSPEEIYGENAAAFDEATTLEELDEHFHELLATFVDDLAGPDVLDAGCGPGRDVEYFHSRGLDPIGIDIADGMVAYARENRPGEYLRMDLRSLAFADDSFDGVWCPASVFFVPVEEMQDALDEFTRVLRPGGIARIGFKLGDGPIAVEKWGGEMMEYHVSEDEARELLEAAGFTVESTAVNALESGATFVNLRCTLTDRRETPR